MEWHDLTQKLFYRGTQHTDDKIIRKWLSEKAQYFNAAYPIKLEDAKDILGLTPDPVGELSQRMKEAAKYQNTNVHRIDSGEIVNWEELSKLALEFKEKND